MIKFDKLWVTMKDKGITSYKLREIYEVDPQTIARLKANKNITTDTLNKLCSILNCNLSEIAEYVPDLNNEIEKNL
jgi:DNA-binding Xre family transcriptional regulator